MQRFTEPYSDPRWWYGGTRLVKCFECTHFRGMVKGKVRCMHFPDEIPNDILRKEEMPCAHFEQYAELEGY